ncbi:hypothetical protein A2673_01650 [Candidatus Kaiserbacteria bacterium RIFCSPHIGHO2_01_FULL_50_13]|uniref:VTT domain-containing protein n=1 Tax=Candidatus Kaiserbacteria bacterium RIFCSPLOWO2_01_FULL_50_24 TaxID=1798507 RepID=A0A1F6EMG8_9BACT|nr:MAG: hypothetical protein A2673_01650 [Candidatus Kaiserbacteria bacterium RIFCSPHIGHO2_01_FULL_50_13]OGG74836.1 MAG: hypothetical protein A3A34_00350 [Candidatus Kaiserbacteria bacterium RIFCSPLOWO2_01_FULL_50_24]OGG81438.1 MAG: hypothetical protein A3H74_03135 [Candidatus Kaiserbacteria bacterium RIFCSPLOWO2_02_FULL_51_13]
MSLTEIVQIVGYPGIFAIVLAESGLFFAVSLPGASLLFTAGFLASQGYFNIWILTALVMIAAILGDTIGYWFGAWVGPKLFYNEDSRFFKKRYVDQTRRFYEKYGTRTILFARFVPIVRTFAPILAGVGEMEYKKFLFYNILGAVLWGGGFTFGGYLLGEVIPGIEHYILLVVLAIIVVSMMPLVVEWIRHRRKDADTPNV